MSIPILRLIAQGWSVIESDGDQMTIHAPDDWTDEECPDGRRELLIDTRAAPAQVEGELENAKAIVRDLLEQWPADSVPSGRLCVRAAELLNGSAPAQVEAPVLDREAVLQAWIDSIGFAPWLWAAPALDGEERRAFTDERLKHPYVLAQPFTPGQYALVLRWDLGTIRHEMIRLRALVDIYRRQQMQDEHPPVSDRERKLEEEARPITMQDVRLAVGEGKLTPADVLAGCNAELKRRAALSSTHTTKA